MYIFTWAGSRQLDKRVGIRCGLRRYATDFFPFQTPHFQIAYWADVHLYMYVERLADNLQPQSTYRGRVEVGECICPLSWSIHQNFVHDGKYSERGWACTPPPPTRTSLGKFFKFFHHDGMYARKWPLPLCVYSGLTTIRDKKMA
jgi:hypothetical protein